MEGYKNSHEEDDSSTEIFDEAESQIRKNHEEKVKSRLRRSLLMGEAAIQNADSEEIGALFGIIPGEYDDREGNEDDEESFFPLSMLYPKEEVFGDVEQEPKEEEPLSERMRVAEEAMRELISESWQKSAHDYRELSRAELAEELAKKRAEMEARSARRRSSSKELERAREVRKVAEKKMYEARDGLEELGAESPEGFTVVRGMEVREHARELRNRELVTTRYVKRNLEMITKDIEDGTPVFIHGHLGSGKTELAITAARRSSISKAALLEVQDDLRDYYAEHPEASAEELRAAQARFYRKRVREYERSVREGDKEACDRFNPLVICGSRDTDTRDLFVEKSLKASSVEKSVAEMREEVDKEVEKWIAEHREELDAMDEVERKAKIIDISYQTLELYKTKNQSFGTEVEKIEKEIIRAAREGRPVIIDEANTIPSSVLLSLNHILTRRPGDQINLPGVDEPIKVKDGFCIIMTGNLGDDYIGRSELDIALESRMHKIEHDYIPMSHDKGGRPRAGEDYESSEDRDDELFQLVIESLVDRQGNLSLHDMDKNLDKLYAMCQLAKASQLIFEGKWVESGNFFQSKSSNDLVPKFEKTVFSVRHLLNVLDDWEDGGKKSLEMALWDRFISSVTSPQEQMYLLRMAESFGLFPRSEGWHLDFDETERKSCITLDEIYTEKEERYEYGQKETYSIHKVVELLYGAKPERQIYPEGINFDELEDSIDGEITIEDYMEAEEKIKEVGKTIQALEVLAMQCGCSLDA